MSIFKKIFSKRPGNVLHTPHGDFNLAAAKDVKKVKSIIASLQLNTENLTRRDIQAWRKAWQMAIDTERPDRSRLYGVYNDVQVDLHLSGCIGQRKGFVLAKEFKLMDAKGVENEDAKDFFDRAWFKQFCNLALDSVYWGHSLIELGDVVKDEDGRLSFSEVKLIPRKHVVPEFGRVIVNEGDEWKNGIPYREGIFADSLIEVGDPHNLGLYLKAATETIPKKNMLAYWNGFGETFGMPMRIARTTTRDEKEREMLEKMLQNSASSLYAITGMDTEIQFVESSRSDSFNVYDKRIDRANSELSKLVIGQTMTIEDGSSLSQSQTHLEVFENIIDSDRDLLRDVINNQLLPKMVFWGFPLKGLKFEWDDTINYTPEQQLQYEKMIADRYEVEPSYFEKKYGMPVGERRQLPAPQSAQSQEEEEEDKKKKQKNFKPFFD